jgi:hypothetical protein
VYLVWVVLVSGLDPSVVYQMTALAVASAMVMLSVDPTYTVPLAGLIVGVATVAAAAKVTVTVAGAAAA